VSGATSMVVNAVFVVNVVVVVLMQGLSAPVRVTG
jgi:hypothetical protein